MHKRVFFSLISKKIPQFYNYNNRNLSVFRFCTSSNFMQEVQAAEQLFKDKSYEKALDSLYNLEEKYSEQDQRRIRILNVLASAELEIGNIDQAKLFNEEAMNIYHIQKSISNKSDMQSDEEYYRDLMQHARIYTVKANVQGKLREENSLLQTLGQSKELYQECYENIEQFKDEPRDQKIIRQELALILTKIALAQNRTQQFDDSLNNIQYAMDIWKEVEDFSTQNSYKFTLIVYGLVQVMKKNYDEGIAILSEAKKSFDAETMKNNNMANLYMGSLCILAPVFQKSNTEKYQQLLGEFDQALDLLAQNSDRASQELHAQYTMFRKYQLK